MRFARPCIVALLFLTPLSTAMAQDTHSYLGVGGAYFAGATTPVLSFQVGAAISDVVELRVTLDTLVSVNVFSADLLFILEPDSAFEVYLGFGPDLLVLLVEPTAGISLESHGIAGVEFSPSGTNVGLYVEAKPFLVSTLRSGALASEFRAGINYYF